MNKPKKTKIKSLIATLILILGGISYLLADRYLIQHVEVADVSAATVITSEANVATSNTSISIDSETVVDSRVTTPTMDSTTTSVPTFADDWNYTSDGLTIFINRITTGSGQDTLTYFVADVVLSDATQLSNAFANDMFGRNIIETTSQIASDNDAIFAINGDYYGFREDGIIIRNGVIYRDVPARTGLAFYLDGSMKIYDETQISAKQLLADGVWNTLSFGPTLLVDSIMPTNLTQVEVDHNFGNHSIQSNQPRTGIGIIDENHYVFIVVDGRSTGYSRGASLTEFAQMFKDLGCTNAYNIDGGGSSTMYFMGRVVNNPLGRNKERGTSDILYIG
jgi:exopolysaccharide biosynthesis protein